MLKSPPFARLAVLVLAGLGATRCGPSRRCVNPSEPGCSQPQSDAGNDAGAGCTPACSGSTPVCDTSHNPGTCGVCTAVTGCSGIAPICDTAQAGGLGACVFCTASSGCSGATPRCDTSVGLGRCVGCLSGADCSGPTPVCDAASRTCVSADGGVTNETCSGAIALVFSDGGVAAVSGDTTLSSNSGQVQDQSPTCSTTARQSGRALVYSLTLNAAKDVTVVVTPTGAQPSLSPVVYARAPNACASGRAADELSCDNPGRPTPSTTTLYNVAPGTYFLWVNGDQGSAGPFSLDATLSGPTLPPPNDSCATAQALSFADGGTTTVLGTTRGAPHSGALDAGSPTCSTSALAYGLDVVYSYTLGQAQDVALSVAATPGSALDPVLFARAPGKCASGAVVDELGCDNPIFQGEGPVGRVQLLNQPAGTYFVWVSGAVNSSGDFSLTATLSAPTLPPANDSCSGAQAIALPVSGLHGTTYGASNDTNDLCSGVPLGASGPDVVYAFTTAQPGQFTATVTPETSGSGPGAGLFPYLYLRGASDCNQTTGQGSLGCVTGPSFEGGATLVVSSLPAGAYFLIVDSYRTTFATPSGGPFSLDARLDPVAGAPPNAACGSAQSVALAPNPAGVLTGMASGDTRGAGNATSLSCVQSVPMPYVVYQFAAPALTPGVTGYNGRAVAFSDNDDEYLPAISLRTDCANAGDAGEVDCEVQRGVQSGGVVPQAVALALGLDGGESVYAWLGSAQAPDAGGVSGPYGLQVEIAPVPAANDLCSDAIPLAANASLSGSTLGAADDYDVANGFYSSPATSAFKCQSATGPQEDLSGADVVYAFTASTSGPATVRVQPERGFDVALGVLAACAAGQCLQFSDAVFEGGTEQATFNASAGTTYFLIVDGYMNANDARGGFVISVSQ